MILVTGTGRSGTSTVAKVLHEHGISMGNSFAQSDQHDSGYSYEDLECRKLNAMFLRNDMNYMEYLEKLCEYGRKRSAEGKWGVKHPATCYVLGIYLQVFSPIVIRCTRDKEMVVKSCMRCYNFTREKAEKLYDNWTVMLDSVLARMEHLEIDFTERVTEDEIWSKISDYLDNGQQRCWQDSDGQTNEAERLRASRR